MRARAFGSGWPNGAPRAEGWGAVLLLVAHCGRLSSRQWVRAFLSYYLKNVGTYFISGQVTLINNSSAPAFVSCGVQNAAGELPGPESPSAQGTIPSNDGTTIPMTTLSENGYLVTSTPNTSLWIACGVQTDTQVLMQEGGSFNAIQLQ